MKKTLGKTLLQLAIVVASMLLTVYGVQSQTINPVGSYVYKTYRKGKGGFENHLAITQAAKGKFHVSFEGVYFYMAGKDETFHEGSGEGDGQLNGNILTASLDDGAGGSCRLTLTFNETLVTNEYTVTVKSGRTCQLNSSPEGLYRKEGTKKKARVPGETSNRGAARAPQPTGFDICPDLKAPCHSAMRHFAGYELPFRLPAKLKARKLYKSVPFYAILVKTYEEEECDGDGFTTSIERERVRIQKTYPSNKVFGSYNCPDMDAIGYDWAGSVDSSGRVLISTFIAVYAGKSPDEAREFLGNVQTLFPQAALKQMTASYEIIDQ